MSFRISSTYVNHARLPDMMGSPQDWDAYVFDIIRELFAVARAWLEYSSCNPIDPRDAEEMQKAVSQLEALRRQAIARRPAQG